MTQHYVSSKIVTAWTESRQDVPGYAVKYEDGYTSWSPAAPFEASSVPLGQIGHLPPHQQRVVAELEQLADRVTKLEAFLHTPLYASLPQAERVLLKLQADTMVVYMGILNDRVSLFGHGGSK